MRITLRSSLLAAVAAASLLAACGGDDSKSSSTTVPEAATTAPAGTSATGATVGGSATTASGGAATTAKPGGGSTDKNKVCALLTTEEVGAAMGIPMADGVAKEIPSGSACNWDATDSSNAALVFVQVYNGKRFYAPDKQLSDQRKPTTGLGEEGYVDDASHTVVFHKGDTVVFMNEFRGKDTAILELAKLVAGRL